MAKAFRYALKHSLPILISYIPVALAYGVLMQNCGYNFVWTGACSIFCALDVWCLFKSIVGIYDLIVA